MKPTKIFVKLFKIIQYYLYENSSNIALKETKW